MVMGEIPGEAPEAAGASAASEPTAMRSMTPAELALRRANTRAVVCAIAAVALVQPFTVAALIIAVFGLSFAFQARRYRQAVARFNGLASLIAALACVGVVVFAAVRVLPVFMGYFMVPLGPVGG